MVGMIVLVLGGSVKRANEQMQQVYGFLAPLSIAFCVVAVVQKVAKLTSTLLNYASCLLRIRIKYRTLDVPF
jgi:hypothetical protein